MSSVSLRRMIHLPGPGLPRVTARIGAALGIALLAACQQPGAARSGQTVDPAASPLISASPSISASPRDAAQITLAFAGDVHFTGRTLLLLDDPQRAFGPISATLAAADVAMVNLETAVTTRGTPEPKQFHFRAPPGAYQALQAAGVDVVSLANNHALDYGRVGLADTLKAARGADVPAVGAGADASAAYAPWVTQVRGTRIAFLAFSQISELWSEWKATQTRAGIAMTRDLARATAAVRAARERADVVVIYVHWGTEGENCPTGEMRAFADAMAEAGADLIVGTHAHLLLGDGWLGRTFVQYGLGNFLWWRDDAFSNDTGVLQVTVRDGRVASARFLPAVISRSTGQPVPAAGAEKARIEKKYTALRACTGLKPSP